MKFLKSVNRQNIFLIIIIGVFTLYFGAITYFLFRVDPVSFFESITQSPIFLFILVLIFALMFFIVIYNSVRIIIDRVRNREGSKFRLRLTFFFLLVTLIPIVPLSLISNNLISKSINLWFVRGVEGSLVNAIEVSKELFKKYAEEGRREWRNSCLGCDMETLRDMEFERIDGIVYFDETDNLQAAHIENVSALAMIRDFHDAGELPTNAWKRLALPDTEYLVFPADEEGYYLLREIPTHIQEYTGTISTGLQNYRTLKIIRRPIKLIVTLFFVVITMPFVLLSFYLSLIISRQVTVPIQELAKATQHIAEDDLDYAIHVSAKDELKLLIDSFNRMIRDLKLNKELLKHSERSAAWRDIARKIAHEIKNPLTPIKLSAERLLKQYKHNDRYREVLSKAIGTIIAEVENLTEMVNEFSHFARFPDTVLGKHDIIAIVDDILAFLKDAGINKDVTFEFTHEESPVYLLVDNMQIRRAILNVIYNSINAIEKSGVIVIHGYAGDDAADNGEKFILSITDNGVGIDPEFRDRVFDPYFSTSSEGSGLGLAIVEKIVLDNNGRIWLESEPGKTTFYLEFKRA
jgi:nitrogen fixation/metabolism regulation signal transduction histidine kinase